MSETELIDAPKPDATKLVKTVARHALIEDVCFGMTDSVQRLCSFDTQTDEGLAREITLDNPTDFKATETDGLVLNIVHWLAGRRTLPDPKTGEMRDGPFLAFELDDGSTWGTGSAGCVRSWAKIVASKGRGPYKPPLRVMVKHLELSGKRNYFILLPVSGLPQ